jgi:hypothetical protein
LYKEDFESDLEVADLKDLGEIEHVQVKAQAGVLRSHGKYRLSKGLPNTVA